MENKTLVAYFSASGVTANVCPLEKRIDQCPDFIRTTCVHGRVLKVTRLGGDESNE